VNWFDAQTIIDNLGSLSVFGVALIIFFETATILGSFLPGDSLLFILGLTLGTWLTGFPFPLAVLVVTASAIAGSQVGYYVGLKTGPRLFRRKDGLIFNHKTLERTEAFFHRYGARAIVMARFVPVLRALIPMLVAMTAFEPRRFLKLNIIGGIAWVVGVMTAGYLLGYIPFVKQHVEFFVLGFVVLSSLPLPFELLRERIKNNRAAK
jgi:membrane-associated protein